MSTVQHMKEGKDATEGALLTNSHHRPERNSRSLPSSLPSIFSLRFLASRTSAGRRSNECDVRNSETTCDALIGKTRSFRRTGGGQPRCRIARYSGVGGDGFTERGRLWLRCFGCWPCCTTAHRGGEWEKSSKPRHKLPPESGKMSSHTTRAGIWLSIILKRTCRGSDRVGRGRISGT